MNILTIKKEITKKNQKIIQDYINNPKKILCKFLIDNFKIDITNDKDII